MFDLDEIYAKEATLELSALAAHAGIAFATVRDAARELGYGDRVTVEEASDILAELDDEDDEDDDDDGVEDPDETEDDEE